MTAPRPLHIVHTESSCGWGGQEIRILEEARGMLARGHRVTLLCPAEAKICTRAADWGLQAVALPIRKKTLGALWVMRRWLAAHADDIDVLNTHSSTDSWLAALAVQTLHRRLPIVRTRHISAPVKPSAANRWLYARAACFVATTGETLRQELVDNLGVSPTRSASIPTGIDTARFTPGDRIAARVALGLEADAAWIGIVATLRSWKGHRYLLEALQTLPAPVRLAIVGDGPQREALQTRVQELGLASRVHFAGNQTDVVPWLRALDVFALPSYANEGVSQAVMQAMAVGLPVVTTPVGSMTDVIRDSETGLLVTPENVPSLAAALSRLCEDRVFAATLGQRAHAFAGEHCGLERMVSRMEQVFLDAAQGVSR